MKCKSPSKWMITGRKSRWFHRISMYAPPSEAALPVLRTQLAESGIQLGQSNISGESFSGQQQAASQQQQSQRTANHEPLAGEDDDTLPVPVSLQGRVTGNSGVDIFA